MGFFNSLKGQVGRDTGRLISNKFFGNRHATKYQKVEDTKAIEKSLELEQKLDLELLRQEKNFKIDLLNREEEINDIQNKKAFVDQNLKKIITMKVPLTKELLIENLYSLSIEITSNKWKDTEDKVNKISNDYTDAIFKKYEQLLFILKDKFPNSVEIVHFEKQYNKYARQAFFQKYKLVLIGVLFVIICVIGMSLEKKQKQETPIKNFLKSLTEK